MFICRFKSFYDMLTHKTRPQPKIQTRLDLMQVHSEQKQAWDWPNISQVYASMSCKMQTWNKEQEILRYTMKQRKLWTDDIICHLVSSLSKSISWQMKAAIMHFIQYHTFMAVPISPVHFCIHLECLLCYFKKIMSCCFVKNSGWSISHMSDQWTVCM